MDQKDSVATKSSAYSGAEEVWSMVSSLLGGTNEMRRLGTLYMPKFPAETDEQYTYRLKTATLYPAYEHTVVVMAAKPYTRPITIPDDIDEQLKQWLDNLDREGRNVTSFMCEVSSVALAYGQSHVFIDSPPSPRPGVTSVQEERDAGIRPYMVLVKPTQMLGVKHKGGMLTEVRFIEEALEDDGRYGEKTVKQIRVLTVGKCEIYRQMTDAGSVNAGAWELHESYVMTIDEIPFVTFYSRRTGFMISRPPMKELAYMNIKHWQSQSDQDALVHVVRVPLLTVSGVDPNFTLTLGSHSAVRLPTGAAMAYVEHSGAAIGSGKVSLDDLKEEMRQAGAEMMVPRYGPQKTATEVGSEDGATKSELQRIVEDLEDSLALAVALMCKWAKVNQPKDRLIIFKEFGVLESGGASAPVVMQAVTSGILSKQSGYEELQRRGIINVGRTWEDENERLEDEGPPEGKTDPVTGLPYKEPARPEPTIQ